MLCCHFQPRFLISLGLSLRWSCHLSALKDVLLNLTEVTGKVKSQVSIMGFLKFHLTYAVKKNRHII